EHHVRDRTDSARISLAAEVLHLRHASGRSQRLIYTNYTQLKGGSTMRIPTRKSMMTILILIVVAALALTGCMNNNTGSSTDTGSSNVKTGNEGTDSPANEPKGERITLKVELFDRNNTPAGEPPITDNFMTKYVQENFGDPNNIDVEFVTVPRAEE